MKEIGFIHNPFRDWSKCNKVISVFESIFRATSGMTGYGVRMLQAKSFSKIDLSLYSNLCRTNTLGETIPAKAAHENACVSVEQDTERSLQ